MENKIENKSIRGYLFLGLIVLSLFSLVALKSDNQEKLVAEYPIKQVSNVLSAVQENPKSSTEIFDFQTIDTGDTHPIVYTVEYELSTLKIFQEKPDETFDQATADALKQYQDLKGLETNGLLNQETIVSLFSK